MNKHVIKRILLMFGIDPRKLRDNLSSWSIRKATYSYNYTELISALRGIVDDISEQETKSKGTFSRYIELKRRALHAFQVSLLLKQIAQFEKNKITIVDIGDSAGTHMLYIKQILQNEKDINTISVNLDKNAVDKIRAKGLNAIHCRAEELDLAGIPIDFYTSFQMVEHLHNPVYFFRNSARKGNGNRIIFTVPYLSQSRLGLHHIRNKTKHPVTAEEVHIFELSPADWKLLIIHAGWKLVYEEVYYQYPKGIPVVTNLLKKYWRITDFEGFWGAVLEKDLTYSNLYQDWED